jgi:hypothetical protein
LLEKMPSGFTLRPRDQIAELVTSAYDGDVEPSKVLAGLDVAAKALNHGDLGRAMVAAVQMRLPELSWKQAAQLAQAEDRLTKYDETEPRDWRGRWTTGGGSAPTSAPKPTRARVSRPQVKPLGFPKLTPVRLAVAEEIAGGGPEDVPADILAFATLAAGFLTSQIAANRQSTTASGRGRSNSSGPQASSPDPDEDECEDLLKKDMINCQIVQATKGRTKGGQCRSVAMTRYSECLRGGVSKVRTPFYWGN